RPWILSNSLHPSELAIPYAKGYSFPSGHSAMTSSVIGGIAYLIRKRKVLCTFLVILILLVGFSRLWLGVHTPQDVVCGLLTGLFLVFVANFLINWAEKNRNRYLYIAGLVNILAIMAIVYIKFFNTYRIDYVSGEILVDPERTIYFTIITYGFALGILNGCFLCRRFFPFNPKEFLLKNRIIIGIIGAILLFILLKYLLEFIIMNVIALKYATTLMFIFGLFITLIYPFIFTRFKNKL
ncbi:phosphatase PAP2 family protein, partial [bacterium]|nr:phosphatase PAP2 family protein [bacterium]